MRVEYSSVNYKDALATTAKGGVAKISSLVPGIDLAGTVEEAPEGASVSPGDCVLAHGYDLGVAHHGGYAESARVPGEWIVALPEGLSAREAMTIGTAGYTAARSVIALQNHGLEAGDGPVLVTGASGGLGSMAVAMLAATGHHVVASSGKEDEAGWLQALGTAEVIGREEAAGDSSRPLESERWAGAVDCVGGETLAGCAARVASGRRGGGVGQHWRHEGADDRAPLHPAGCIPNRDRLGQHADRGAHPHLAAPGYRPPAPGAR